MGRSPDAQPLTNLDDFDERVVIGVGQRWLSDALVCEHVARYLLADKLVVGTEIVDVACGTGYGTTLLGRRADRRMTGIDISIEAIKHAKASRPGPNIEFRVGDALNLDIRSNSIDSMVSFETIEHVGDAQAFLAEAARILRPGGRLILSTPDRTFYSPGAIAGQSHNPYHTSELSKIELMALLSERFDVRASYGQARVAAHSGERGVGPSLIKRAVKDLGVALAGRGRPAELLLPRVRPNLVPHPLDPGSDYLYLIVMCQKSG